MKNTVDKVTLLQNLQIEKCSGQSYLTAELVD
jgi:hypothetical protein